MKELGKSEQLTQAERNRLDACENDINASNLNLCIEMASMQDKQVSIAQYTGRTTGTISKMVTVGVEAEKFHTMKHCPEGWGALYALSDLTVKQISELCRDKVPTQKDIKDYKIEIGKLPEPPEPTAVVSGNILATLAMLVPAAAIQGASDFAIRSLNRDRKRIEALLDNANKSVSKELMTLFMDVLKYQKDTYNIQLKNYAKGAMKDREAELDQREENIANRESQLVNGIPVKDRKLVLSVVHPDKAPDGMEPRYAKAFDIVRKWN